MSAVSPLNDKPLTEKPNRRQASAPAPARTAPPRPASPRHGPAGSERVPLLRRSAIAIDPAGERLPRGARPLTRTTTAAERAAERNNAKPGPRLEVVPRRRRAVGIVVAACFVLFSLLLGAVAFQTKLAQDQLALDKTERAVRDARERYDILRRQRAQLRSPNRLAVEAERLGMVPAETGELMTIDPSVVAAVAVAASGLPDNVLDNQGTSLEQFGEVKAVTGDAP